MRVFLVRELGKKVLHGIFWANNLDDLWIAVDEMGDPAAFEYCTPIGPGGMWHNVPIDTIREPRPDPCLRDEGFDSVAPVMLCTMSEYMHRTMNEGRHWRRFDCANDGHGMIAQVRRNLAKP